MASHLNDLGIKINAPHVHPKLQNQRFHLNKIIWPIWWFFLNLALPEKWMTQNHLQHLVRKTCDRKALHFFHTFYYVSKKNAIFAPEITRGMWFHCNESICSVPNCKIAQFSYGGHSYRCLVAWIVCYATAWYTVKHRIEAFCYCSERVFGDTYSLAVTRIRVLCFFISVLSPDQGPCLAKQNRVTNFVAISFTVLQTDKYQTNKNR